MHRRTQARFARRTPMPAWRRALAALVALLAAACSDAPITTPDESHGTAPVTVSASLTAAQQAQVRGLSVEVTGPGITTPIVANIGVSGATVNGTVTVPTGAGRVFAVHAFDAGGIETYGGSATTAVRPGTNVVLPITLMPLTGGTPIAVTVGTFTISITPAAPVLIVGSSRTLTATVRDVNGPVAAPEIQWGSSNPVVASLTPGLQSATATLQGDVPGTSDVVASFHGIAAAVSVQVTAGATAIALSTAEGNHACAIVGSGAAYCWGENADGQLGTDAAVSTPQMVQAPGVAFSTIAATFLGTCALTTDGASYCWGRNMNGESGDGTTTASLTPVKTAGGHAFSSLSAGWAYNCALGTDHAAYCWGDNTLGQLGDGTGTARLTPTRVSGVLGYRALSAGASHVCALTLAGAAYCWGDGPSGELGAGPNVSRAGTPTAVLGDRVFTTIASGGAHTCALTTTGATYCWGPNQAGQLGTASVGKFDTSPIPVAADGGLTFAAIAAGGNHTCALTRSGAAYCWGLNSDGQLGGTPSTFSTTPVPVAGGLTFSAIAAGGNTTCGVTTAGAVRCWGNNTYGQLGDGTTASRSVPNPVSFP